MIFKQYGTSYQSVDTNFDAKAMSEIGFRRNREREMPVDDLEAGFVKSDTAEIATQADGSVQTEAEQLMLDRLDERIREMLAELPEGGILVVENQSGHDYPKPRQDIRNVIVEGENRLSFHYTMAPPLRIGVYAPK